MTTALLFAGSLLLIVVASELFTNAVEWAGFSLGLAAGATGSLLAALGTALPETTVPVVALLRGGPSADGVAVGAIVGAPFLLATLGMGATGLATMLRRSNPVLRPGAGQVHRDLGVFCAVFAVLVLATVLPRPVRAGLAVLLLLVYAAYVVVTLRSGEPTDEVPDPLHLLRPFGVERPHGAAVSVQLAVGVGALIVGAELFIRALERVSDAAHLPTLLLALILVPLATELPETLNSVIWVRAGDDHLAMGNVAGAMVFQACLPGALGLAFTTWSPGRGGLVSAALTWTAATGALLLMRRGWCRGRSLVACAIPWAGYAAVVLTVGGRL